MGCAYYAVTQELAQRPPVILTDPRLKGDVKDTNHLTLYWFTLHGTDIFFSFAEDSMVES